VISFETFGATWKEIEGDTWVFAGSRMKEGAKHRVPLTAQALALLGERGADDDQLFPSLRRKHIGDLARMKGYTAHGFRSAFVEWVTTHPILAKKPWRM
jgi:integrase